MYRLHLYLTDYLKKELAIQAKITGKTKAEIVRETLEKNLKNNPLPKSNSAKALLELAEMAEALPSHTKDPHDISSNHDYYAWDGKKIKQ